MPIASLRARLTAPALKDLLDHWCAVRAGRRLPVWSDLDPVVLARHLPVIWAWRWDQGLGTFVGRLAGEEIESTIKCRVRGRTLDEVFPEIVTTVQERYRRVMETPAIVHATGRPYAAIGGVGVGERLILPLGRDGRNPPGVVGATTYRLADRPVPVSQRQPWDWVLLDWIEIPETDFADDTCVDPSPAATAEPGGQDAGGGAEC